MSAPTKPKVLHVYRSDGPNPLWIDQHCTAPYPDPTHRLCRGEYLGEYVPAPGPVVAERWEVRWLDSAGARCSITCPHRLAVDARLATLPKGSKRVRVVHVVRRKVAK